MRDPRSSGWPDDGERTSDGEIARRWAWAYLDLMRGHHRDRALGRKPSRILGEAVNAYLETRERRVEPATVQNDRSALQHLLDAHGPGKRVETMGPDDFQGLADDLLDRGYKVTTIATYLGQLGGFAQWAGVEVGDVRLPDPGEVDLVAWDEEQRDQLRWAAARIDEQQVGKFPTARLAVDVGLSMGLRQGEIFALRWEDIDPGTCTVRVQWQLPKDRRALKPLKGKRARTALVLPGWWPWHRADATGFILHHRGRPVNTRTQRNLITRVLDTAGLNELGAGWHRTRHSYAREFIERGGLLQELRVALGHSSIRITEEAYGSFMEDVAMGLARSKIYGNP